MQVNRIAPVRSKSPLGFAAGGRIEVDSLTERYVASGGLISGDRLATRLSDHVDQAISLVARWIIMRRIICLRCQGQLMLPIAQLDSAGLYPCVTVEQAIKRLPSHWDELAIATWFVTPTPVLKGRWPISCLAVEPVAVLSAAEQS